MKKFIYILTILCSFFIFLTNFENQSIIQTSKIGHASESFAEHEDLEILNFQYHLGNDVSTRKERYGQLIDFLEDKDCYALFYTSTSQENYKDENYLYIMGSNALYTFDFFDTLHTKRIDFTKESNLYFSNMLNDPNAYDYIAYVDSVNNQPYQDTLEIRHFSSYKQYSTVREGIDIDLELNLLSKDRLLTQAMVMNSEIYDYIDAEVGFREHVGSSYKGLLKDRSFAFQMIGLCVLAIAILLTCQIFRSKKEIIIRKMMGHSFVRIFKEMFITQLFLCILFYIVVQILFYAFYVHSFNRVTFPLLMKSWQDFMIFLIFLIVSSLYICFCIVKVKDSGEMKRQGSRNFFSYASIVVKIVFIIVAFAPFVNYVLEWKEIAYNAYALRAYRDHLRGYVGVSGISSFDYDPTKIMQFFDEQGAIYQDFEQIILFENMKEFDTSLQHTTIYPYIIVNKAYLKEYSVIDVENTAVDIEKLQPDTLLIPQKYEGLDTSYYCPNTSCDIVMIKNGNRFINHHAYSVDMTLNRKDPIVLVVGEIPNWSATNMLLENTDKNKQALQSYLKANGLLETVHLKTTDDYYELAKDESNTMFVRYSMVFLLYILLAFIFQYQSIYIQFDQRKHEYAINYLLGKTFWQRYGNIFYNNILMYSFVLVYGIFFAQMTYFQLLAYLLCAIVVDILVAYYMIHYFEKHKVIAILKGEQS